MYVKGSALWLAPSKSSIKVLFWLYMSEIYLELPKRTKMNYPKEISLCYEIQRIIGQPSYGKNKEESESLGGGNENKNLINTLGHTQLFLLPLISLILSRY